LKKKLRQKGIDPNTHQPICELAEINDKDKQLVADDKSNIQKTSVGSNEVKNLFDDTPIPNPNSIPMDNCNYHPLENFSSTSKINNCFIPSSDMVGLGGSYNLSFQQLNYGINNIALSPNSNNNNSLCFIPSTSGSNSTCSQMMSELNSSTMYHSMFQTTPNTKHINPSNSISSGDVDGIQNWEFSNNNTNNPSKSSNGSSCSNINFIDQENHQVVEEIKWSEYLNSTTPFYQQHQNTTLTESSSIMYNDNEIKQEMGFINNSHHQQRFEDANSDIYSNKDLQRFSLAFGQTL
jgi:myb proto-oncogene protein